ncbi:TrmH family RNA methyltransferase [Rubrivirga sp.]|uniref:TrmH family RNA methyltransferase n=1 Tax=Rubrivirga sp. TaxID=1885344 RepID=UPI003C72F6BF
MTRQRLKDLASLSRGKGRRAHGQFLVEGLRSVEAALEAGAPLVEVVLEAGAHPALTSRALEAGVEVAEVSARDLERVASTRSSQGVVAVSCSIVSDEPVGLEGSVLILDGVQDPGNVGALVRTAAWFGVTTVVADEKTADFESPKAVRASMGGLWDVRLVRVPGLEVVLDALQTRGGALWGADLEGVPLNEWTPSSTDALVVGSEAHGLSANVRSRLEGAVQISGAPSRCGVESLNVAVASGILVARWLA